MRLQAELHQFGMAGVVIMLFRLHARIRQVIDFDVEVQLPTRRLDQMGQFQHRELLRELIKHSAFTGGRAGFKHASSTQRTVSRISRYPRVCSPLCRIPSADGLRRLAHRSD